MYVVFWVYAIVAIFLARWFGHAMFHGWLAHLGGMLSFAAMMLPWSKWLAPRLARVLSVIGRIVLVGCYFLVLAPFALILRFTRSPALTKRLSSGSSRWVQRPDQGPPSLELARMEG